jgi:hypothetical protein
LPVSDTAEEDLLRGLDIEMDQDEDAQERKEQDAQIDKMEERLRQLEATVNHCFWLLKFRSCLVDVAELQARKLTEKLG